MKDILNKRREEFLKDKPAPYVAVIYSGNGGKELDRNFFYYTNIKRANMILMMVKMANGVKQSRLFIEPYDEVMAKWVGARMKRPEAIEISGIGAVDYVENFESAFFGILNMNRGKKVTVGLDLWTNPTKVNPAIELANKVKSSYPTVDFEDVYDTIAAQRMIKDESEVANMMVAQKNTLSAIKAMLAHATPEMNEAELEGVFDLDLKKNVIKEYAFPTICAGGPRACVLHYGENNQVVHDGEMVLIDLGSSYNYYCSDISRTFPINGKFTARQKEVYDVVLGAQNMVLATAKPGMTLLELNDCVIKYYAENLPKIGLLKDGKTVRDYYYHSVSHQLGLVCHDVGDRSAKLLPGMVISNEPGLYIEEEGIGIRIEDDIMITETGAINLSAEYPHTTEEIEALMVK